MSSNNTTEPKQSVYSQYTTPGYRFNMTVPMLQKDKDGNMLHLPMVVLTTREQQEAETKAYNDTRACFKDVPKKDEHSNWDQIMDNNRAAYIIYYSVRLPNDLKTKWFNDKKQVEDTYTIEECSILMNNYLTVKINQPHLKTLDVEDPSSFQSMIDMIKKDAESDFFLNGYTTHSVNQLVKYLVAQLVSLQTDSGLSGTH
jgi:hypothetical protein